MLLGRFVIAQRGRLQGFDQARARNLAAVEARRRLQQIQRPSRVAIGKASQEISRRFFQRQPERRLSARDDLPQLGLCQRLQHIDLAAR